MGQTGRWISGHVPPDEAYWEALLREGENGKAAPFAAQADPWSAERFDVPEPQESTETGTLEDQWTAAQEAMAQEEILELPIIGCNRGGVLVGWNDLRGFVPASHLLKLVSSADETERYNQLRRLVGTQLRLKIIELDREHRRFVLSERAAHVNEDHRDELLDRFSPGDICQGCVTNLCSFGAFVDLGGLEGLAHVSELSWGRVEHPSDVLEPGQSVEVYVLNVDRARGRVGLSVKRLQPDPWQLAEERYHVGQTVECVITHVVDFGAFARVEEGLEGLIHVSELADGNVPHPRNVVHEGDIVTARVLSVDGERRRMGLSMREGKADDVQEEQK
jgi:small subunit ribosomal protein S1